MLFKNRGTIPRYPFIFLLVILLGGVILSTSALVFGSEAEADTSELDNLYRGSVIIEAPVNMGVFELELHLNQDGSGISGTLENTSTSHLTSPPQVSVEVDQPQATITPTFKITSAPLVESVGGQTITRTVTIEGEVLWEGVYLRGTYSETIEGYTQQPLVISGPILLASTAGSSLKDPVATPSNPTATPGASVTPDPTIGVTPEPTGTASDNYRLYLPLIVND